MKDLLCLLCGKLSDFKEHVKIIYYCNMFLEVGIIVCLASRCGSRINTDWSPKWVPKVQASRGVRGSSRKVVGFLTPIRPVSRVSESFTWDDGQISTWKVFFIIKNIFIMKNLTDFCKMVEASVDLCLARRKFSKNKHIKLTFYWWYQTAFVLLVLHWFQFCLLPDVFAPEQYLFSYQVCPHPR